MTHAGNPESVRNSRKSRLACRVPRHRRLRLEPLESRQLLAVIAADLGWLEAEAGTATEPSANHPTDWEQYLLELINRGRADPEGEAARHGVALNQGLDSGSISPSPKQPLAFSLPLIAAARGHSQWMLATNTLNHTGQNGCSPYDRMVAAGYSFTPPWSCGENIGWWGTSCELDWLQSTHGIHADLFESAGHRQNQLREPLREVGLGMMAGEFETTRTWNALMVTQKFAYSGNDVLLTGVVYDDHAVLADSFYTPGEGLGGVTVEAYREEDGSTFSTQTWDSGGYTLPLPSGTYSVMASGGALESPMLQRDVVIALENVKVDFDAARASVPYVPQPEETFLRVERDGGSWHVEVEIMFSDSGFAVPDWGTVQCQGATFSVNATVQQSTGPALTVITPLMTRYPLGPLDDGEYLFEFSAHGQHVASLAFTLPESGVASTWQNPQNRYDVMGNGRVFPQDALSLINEINLRGSRHLPMRAACEVQPPFWDVNGDGALTAQDVLLVVNYLNQRLIVGGEPEPVSFVGSWSPESLGAAEPLALLPHLATAPPTRVLPPGAAREIVFRDIARPDWQRDGELEDLDWALLDDRLAVDPADAFATVVSGTLGNAGHVIR